MTFKTMKQFLVILMLLSICSCIGDVRHSKDIWMKHEVEFEAIVNLLKEERLHKVYGRAGYEIPDSFQLKKTNGSIVFRETDFSFDSSHSILFRIGFDSTKILRSYPTIVYTDNPKRLKEYNSKHKQVEKLKDHWYFLSRQ